MLKKIVVSPLTQTAVLTALVLAVMLGAPDMLAPLENRNYDFWADHFRSPKNSPIAIVAIDEKSVARIGDWPWPRSQITEMVRLLTRHGAEAQGYCLLYTHPDLNPGLNEIESLREQIGKTKWRGGRRTTNNLEKMLDASAARLNQDDRLIAAIRRARNVVLPIRFTAEDHSDGDGDKLSGVLIINSLNAHALPAVTEERPWIVDLIFGDDIPLPIAANGVQETFDELATKAGAMGYLNLQEDADGRLRRVPLLMDYQGRLFPAFAMQLVLKHLGVHLRDLNIELDVLGQPSLQAKHLQLSTDHAYRMMVNFNTKWTRERTCSFVDLLDGTLDPAVLKDKIVLIGPTGEEMTQRYRVGNTTQASAVEINANLLARILSPVRLTRPAWTRALEIMALLYFSFFLALVIPRVNVKMGGAILAVFIATWYAMTTGLLAGYGYWIKFYGPALLGLFGFVSIHATNFSRKRKQEKLDANKTLGLAYQGQGLLDMACEKFMQCPIEDESVKNLFYNLALDFERKRMFNKALAIYRHIRTDGTFRDIVKRSERLKPLDETTANPAGTGGKPETTMLMDDTCAMPTFGRYELIKELGRGSMGTVFLGRDPKIHREVAIKTLDYTEVETSELAEVKARFFREAEAAGKLSHPNIVAVYDLGEEHDMAYIAMELLTGETLSNYCKKDNLPSIERTLTIISEVTMALAYAHEQGVIHRDIKPANIMMLDDGRVKVTDFGIAQVVDASQTRTGVILGTPNYMSPEQVAGEKMDGRSDLFSMGVVLYELLSGAKPFKGDSITTILYAINNNAHTPLREHREDIPPCCEALVNKLLAKKASRRYKTAGDALKAIRACMIELQ